MKGKDMRLKSLWLPASICFALAACDGEGSSIRITASDSGSAARGGVLKVVDALQCPDTLGVLTRKGSAQAGGANCIYTGPRGAEVVLHMVPLNADTTADAVLTEFETRLSAALPEAASRVRADAAAAQADAAAEQADVAAAQADAAAVQAGERTTVQGPGVRIETTGDDANVRLPGLSIRTQGDKASINIGGLSIRSNDGQGVRTETTSVSIQSHGDVAEVRTRAPGEATRMTYILTDDAPSQAGWRLAGFEARGPAGGPIVVATVRAKDRHDDSIFDDAKELVTLNVGE